MFFNLYFLAIESNLDLKLKIYTFLECIFNIDNISCQTRVFADLRNDVSMSDLLNGKRSYVY